jgi:hypothetical protein
MKLLFLFAALLVLLGHVSPGFAQGTAFTYQGRLTENGAPGNGSNDFTFTLYTAGSGGATVGTSNLVNDLFVTNGLFIATLDYGASAFDGSARWLQIAVRPGASVGAYTSLAPRQPITAAPYAIYAGGVTASGISGTIAPANIGAGSLTTVMLAAGAVGSNQLAAGAVTTGALADGAVTSPKVATVSNWFAVTFANPTPIADDFFGYSVAAVGSDRVLIGAHHDDTGAGNAGAAYLFSANGTLLTTFTNPFPAAFDFFGYSVAAVGSDRVLIGAYQGDVGATDAGAAYLFNTNGALLTNFFNHTPVLNEKFGCAVAALGSDRVLIGAWGNDTGATDAGAAYLFSTNGTLLTIFTNPTPAANDFFGWSVAAVGSGRLLIGAYNDTSGGGGNAGAAYLFSTNGTLLTTFTNPTPVAGDHFGISVAALGSDRLLIGARLDDTGAPDSGAAYLFSTNGTLLNTFTNPTPADSDLFGHTVAGLGNDRVLIGAHHNDTGAASAGAAYLFSAESFTPGLVADAVRAGSVTTTSLADGAVIAAKIGGVLQDGQIPELDASKTTSGILADARLSPNVALRAGGNAFTGNQTIAGSMVVDQDSQNNGNVSSNSLTFGSASGEGIASKRTVGGNQWGLDFYTAFQNRMTIVNGGNVGINKTNPATTLDVNGGVRARGGPPGAFGVNNNGYAFSGNGNGDEDGGMFSSANGQVEFYANALERMRITDTGNVGIGTTQPSARLSLVAPGASEVGGTARSATLLTSAGDLGTVAGNELALATFGFGSGNNSSLGIHALRVANDSGWPDTAIGLGMDVDNTVRAGASLWLHANGNVGIGTNSPSTKLEVNGAVTASSFSGNGSGLTSLNGSQLTSGTVNNLALADDAVDGAKILNGSILSKDVNAASFDTTFWRNVGNAATGEGQFVGTTDNQPLEFKVNNQRALRLEPTANVPAVFSGIVNVVGGSPANFVGAGVRGATIAGGGAVLYTFADPSLPLPNKVTADFGTVGGGYGNTSDRLATVGGGADNTASGGHATVGGGGENNSSAAYATIGGGGVNVIQSGADWATIGGGRENTIQTNAAAATIGGGLDNTNWAFLATIGGGYWNTIQTNATAATIGGGYRNMIHTNAGAATIAGGNGNRIYALVATIGGGYLNTIQPSADSATIGGGRGNTISTSAEFATTGGGNFNSIQPYAHYATIPGGSENSATNYAFAAGHRAKANHTGAFVWADSTDADIASTATDSVTMRASGGYRLFSNGAGAAGASLAPNATSWGILSDRNVKKDFAPVDQRTILEKLAALSITQWHYEWESPDVTPHIGPTAQDFKAAFYPGTDDKTITTQEADGVALAAIQGLNQKVEEKEARIVELERRLEKLERLISRENGGDR